MKSNNKKGFTLVELLVVIAILAVLATVSVVGYTAFISKSNNSNALTELKQAQELVLADLISENVGSKKEFDGVTFFYETGTGRVNFVVEPDFELDDEGQKKFNEDFKNTFENMKQISGTFSCKVNANEFSPDSEGQLQKKYGLSDDCVIADIYYTTENGRGKAVWNSGFLPTGIDE